MLSLTVCQFLSVICENNNASRLLVRITRSGKVVKSPAKQAKAPTTRKTRKKVVLMEVEVSDEEDSQVPEGIRQQRDEPNIDALKHTLEEEMNKITANLQKEQELKNATAANETENDHHESEAKVSNVSCNIKSVFKLVFIYHNILFYKIAIKLFERMSFMFCMFSFYCYFACLCSFLSLKSW